MKVHVLVAEYPYEGQMLLGVYSSTVVAESEARRLRLRFAVAGRLAIYDVEIDAPANEEGYIR